MTLKVAAVRQAMGWRLIFRLLLRRIWLDKRAAVGALQWSPEGIYIVVIVGWQWLWQGNTHQEAAVRFLGNGYSRVDWRAVSMKVFEKEKA